MRSERPTDGGQVSNYNVRAVENTGPIRAVSTDRTRKEPSPIEEPRLSLHAMEEEIRNQLEDLPSFASHLRKQSPFPVSPSRLVFVGSGDSYAAALFARELSDGAAEAWDPYELSLNPESARGKNIVLVSVSGRTTANLELARRLKRIAKKRIAVTANPDSQLAKICDETILLRYRTAGRLTSGTVSFTTSLLACAYVLGKLAGRIDPQDGLARAAKRGGKLTTIPRGAFFLIGSGICRALAEYGACKIQEVLGAKAYAQYPEQLGHAQLFSVDSKHDTIICIPYSIRDRTWDLCRVLSQNGFHTSSVSVPSGDAVARSLEVSFHLQHLALSLARRMGLEECTFLADRRRLRLSNRLIY